MSSDESAISGLTPEDFFKHMIDLKKSFANSAAEVAASIKTEVAAAVAPFHDKQKEIIEDLEGTKQKVSDLALDNAATRAKVDDLQKQVIAVQQTLSANATRPPLTHHTPSSGSPPPAWPASEETHGDPAALQVLRSAKRVLGFSPITCDDIAYLKTQHSFEDDSKAMEFSIIEFLNFEMKVPESVTNNLHIVKVFPPATQPTGWNTLFAEFSSSSETDLINQYVRNLLPGKNMSIFVPNSLLPRYYAVRNLDFSYRNGSVKHKTKIKYGASDFVLLVKPRDRNVPWSYAPLESLPPLQLSAFTPSSSSSPPPGRTRLNSKRARPESPNAPSNPHQRQKTDGAAEKGNGDDKDIATENEEPVNKDDDLTTATKVSPASALSQEISFGSVKPSTQQKNPLN